MVRAASEVQAISRPVSSTVGNALIVTVEVAVLVQPLLSVTVKNTSCVPAARPVASTVTVLVPSKVTLAALPVPKAKLKGAAPVVLLNNKSILSSAHTAPLVAETTAISGRALMVTVWVNVVEQFGLVLVSVTVKVTSCVPAVWLVASMVMMSPLSVTLAGVAGSSVTVNPAGSSAAALPLLATTSKVTLLPAQTSTTAGITETIGVPNTTKSTLPVALQPLASVTVRSMVSVTTPDPAASKVS